MCLNVEQNQDFLFFFLKKGFEDAGTGHIV